MNLWFRLLWVYFGALARKRLEILETSSVKLLCLPNDLDTYNHMNNGRYLTLMDLGRIDLILRTGMGRVAQQHRWYPLVGTVEIKYRKSLRVFQAFELRTRVLRWDEKWFYIEQSFCLGKREVTHAVVKGLFRGRHGNIPPSEVVRLTGSMEVSPMEVNGGEKQL